MKQHIELMSKRMDNIESGNVEEVLRECNSIQLKLLKKQQSSEVISKLFVRYMLFGKVNSAVRLLENEGCQGVLPMNNENLDLLKSKHPEGKLALKGSLLFGPIDYISNLFFDNIDEVMIDTAIKRTKGASGPSNLDSDFFRQVCSRKFKNEGSVLKQNIALLARKLATEELDPKSLE